MPIPGGVNNKVKKLCRQKYFYFTGLYKLNHRKFIKNTLLMKASSLTSDHKIGRKLPFGKKHHVMSFAIIQEDDGPKEEFQDEPI